MWYNFYHLEHLIKLYFCVWCAKCAKNLAFGTFNTSAAGALNIHGYVPTTYLEVELGVHFYFSNIWRCFEMKLKTSSLMASSKNSNHLHEYTPCYLGVQFYFSLKKNHRDSMGNILANVSFFFSFFSFFLFFLKKKL